MHAYAYAKMPMPNCNYSVTVATATDMTDIIPPKTSFALSLYFVLIGSCDTRIAGGDAGHRPGDTFPTVPHDARRRTDHSAMWDVEMAPMGLFIVSKRQYMSYRVLPLVHGATNCACSPPP